MLAAGHVGSCVPLLRLSVQYWRRDSSWSRLLYLACSCAAVQRDYDSRVQPTKLGNLHKNSVAVRELHKQNRQLHSRVPCAIVPARR